jgi:hypothetical protein
MGNALFGSAPKVQTQPSINPQQQALLSGLGPQVSGQYPGSTLNFGQVQPNLTGQYAAPMSDLQNLSLGGIGNLIRNYTGGPASQGVAAEPLGAGIASGEAALTANPVSMIDATSAFNKGVVQPLTEDFSQYVIPAISGQYGRGAGGTFSSDQQGARQEAGQGLARTLAQQGSLFSLDAAKANQAAQAQNAQLQATARAQLPGLVGAPLNMDIAQQGLLSGGLEAGAVPQQTEQRQLFGQFQDYQGILAQIAQQLQLALGAGTASTQNQIVQPGQTGLIPMLLAAAAGGAGKGFAGG